jgi:selenocysteine-specific elongation factor
MRIRRHSREEAVSAATHAGRAGFAENPRDEKGNSCADGEGRRFVLGTAGHIDHGKTALVRALTGVDTDRLPEEKSRGITIDLGFAALELAPHRLAIVDVPGHERFIRNMLAGASGFDLALLVIAADDSVMPQTREHLEILRILGIRAGIVAITKCDLAEPSWVDLVAEEARSLVGGTFLEGCPVVRTSAEAGLGVIELKSIIREVCDNLGPRSDAGPFRMAIDRSFTVAGHGTVVSGTVASGVVEVGDCLDWLPRGGSVRVRGLERHDTPVESAAQGARAAINLAGVHHAEIGRGDELAEPGYLRASRLLTVDLEMNAGSAARLRHRSKYRLHVGTAEVGATLSLLGVEEHAGTGKPLAQLFLSSPVAAVHGQPFVLREESPPTTVGGGRVLQPVARRIRRRDLAARAVATRLQSGDHAERVEAALTSIGAEQWTLLTLCRDSGAPIAEIPGILDRLTASGAMVEVSLGPRRTTRVLATVAEVLEARLLRGLSRLHAGSPRLSAIPRGRLLSAFDYVENEPLVSGLIERLAERRAIVRDRRTIALAGYVPKLSQSERKLKAEIAEAYRSGGMNPPDPAEWVETSNARAAAVRELLTLLCEEERIVPIALDLYMDADVVSDIRRRVVERLSGGPPLSMSDLRDLLGTTRKYAVPIGEYLDRIGLTRREGDVRSLNPPQGRGDAAST